MHVHMTSKLNLIRTPTHKILPEKETRKITYDQNIRALVKYCTPTKITVESFINAFFVCYKEFDYILSDFIVDFVRKVNPIWEGPIINKINKMNFYRKQRY